jgi:hypothetical protein
VTEPSAADPGADPSPKSADLAIGSNKKTPFAGPYKERMMGLEPTTFCEESEHVGEHFLGWFLEEQREEIASMGALLAVVDRATAANMLLAEDYLTRSAVAAEPSTPSPPAAGGAL